MRTKILVASLSLLIQIGFAQQFIKRSSVILPERLHIQQAEWVDLDKDSLLDVVLTGTDQQNSLRLGVFKNITTTSFSYQASGATGFNKGAFAITDLDHDNANDLVISGTTSLNTGATFVFLNKGSLELQKQTDKLLSAGASSVLFSDLDNDGKEDMVLAGTKGSQKFFSIYAATPAGYVLKLDTTGIDVKGIAINTFSSLYKDIILSAEDSDGPVCLVLQNKEKFRFLKKKIASPVAGTVSVGDLNSDGHFDLVISGKSTTGTIVSSSYLYANDEFQFNQTFGGAQQGHTLIADLNSDGLADVAVSGSDNNQKTSFIRFADESLLPLNADGLITQRFGDFDRDGDLDFFQFADSASFNVFRMFENTTSKNKKPGAPTGSFAISTYDKTFLYWSKATDDHTSTPSLTYDVFLYSNKQVNTVEFDTHYLTRMTVSHGNAGTKNSMIFRNLPDGQYTYYIQSIDNAFNGSNPVCRGTSVLCFNLQHDALQACVNETVHLSMEQPSYWFSTTSGFLELADALSFTATAADTVYAFAPDGNCVKNKAWAISVHGNSTKETQTVYACEGKTVKLGIEPGWQQSSWKTKSTTLTGSDSIEFLVTKADTIIVTAKTNGGCTYEKKIFLKLSKPVVTLNGENFLIMKGQSVQLEASGGDHYLWAPGEGLTQANISNPAASPSVTTDYTVTATDSIGCTAQGKVVVQVTESAFVASLFTPNSDGRNDELKVFGLSTASHFKFRIYNREGNTVYETGNIAEATSRGWNGTAHGSPQPSGVYYWKVEGEGIEGDPLLLNGKRSGSVLLVR